MYEQIIWLNVALVIGYLCYTIYDVIYKPKRRIKNMHTSRVNGTTFHHQSDYSGEVLIVVDKSQLEDATGTKVFVEVPFEAIRNFVLEYVRSRSIKNFENMSYDDLVDWATAGYVENDTATWKPDVCSDDHDSISPRTVGIDTSNFNKD